MIIGTAGHIDHGKTALVKALTGTDADRLAEEKARGITIDLGFAYQDLGLAGGGASGRITGFVDVPGHERLIRTMLAGAGGIDFALLVVAADDGVMPQTREHLAILNLLGVRRGVVALTKADLADPARLAAVEAEISALLAPTPLAGAPVFPVSSLSGAGIPALRAALSQAEAETPIRPAGGPIRLSVDRSFTIGGAGTVVTGTLLSGRVRIGDQVMISPAGLQARVRGIHAQNVKTEEGFAGQRCALNLAGEGISKEAVRRGDMILEPRLHAPTLRLDAELTLLASEAKPVTAWFPVHLHSQSAEMPARLVPLKGSLAPGETGLVQLVLDQPIAAAIPDRFILRDTSASRSIGGGHFLDLRAPARKRSTPERLALLRAAQARDPLTALGAMLEEGPVDLAVFLRDRALAEDEGPALLAATGAHLLAGLALSARHLAGLRAGLTGQLESFHAENPDLAGLGRERLRLALRPRLPNEAFLAFLREEAAGGRVVTDGAFLRLPGHEVRLSPGEEALLAQILPALLGEMKFRPPRVRDFANDWGIDEKEVRRVLKHSQKLGRTDQIAHDHFFARETTREMAAILRRLGAEAPDGWFTAALFRDQLQNGRKVAIEILDFYDRLGLTLRRGDLRRLNPHRADLFD